MVIGDVSASKSFQMVCHSINNYLWNLTSCSSITEGNTIFLLLDNIGKIVLPLEFVFLLLFIGWGIVPPWNLLPQSSTPISSSLCHVLIATIT